MCHHVNRIGGDDENSVWCVCQHCRHDFLENERIAMEELQPSLRASVRPLRRARQFDSLRERHSHPPGFQGDAQKARRGGGRPLPPRLGRVLVHQHDLAPHSVHHECIRGSGANKSGPYDTDFHLSLVSLVELLADTFSPTLAALPW